MTLLNIPIFVWFQFTQRLSQRPLYRVSSFEPTKYDMLANPNQFGPLRNAFGLPVKGEVTITASVSHLLFPCSPLTVFRRIVTIIINTINRCAFRSVTHVGIERFKSKPLLTNLYSPAPVSVVTNTFWVQASIFHRVPTVVHASAFHSMCREVVVCYNSIRHLILQSVSDVRWRGAVTSRTPILTQVNS